MSSAWHACSACDSTAARLHQDRHANSQKVCVYIIDQLCVDKYNLSVLVTISRGRDVPLSLLHVHRYCGAVATIVQSRCDTCKPRCHVRLRLQRTL
eukprot:8690-Heterococcus_DN1.PRE.3